MKTVVQYTTSMDAEGIWTSDEPSTRTNLAFA